MMLHMDLQRAEVAFKAGRLEDVVRRLACPKMAGHRAGQELMTRVVDALVQRAQSHLSRGHVAQADEDAKSANRLAGGREDVVDLLNRIQSKVNENQGIEANTLLDEAVQAYFSGRLDRLVALRDRLASVSPSTVAIEEMLQQIRRCQSVSKAMQSGQLDEARRELALMANCFEDNGWTGRTLELLDDVIPQWNQLHSGPLGLTMPMSTPGPTWSSSQSPMQAFAKTRAPVHDQKMDRQRSMLLQIDGLGCLMLLTQPTVTIGSVRQSGRSALPPDIKLETDPISSPLVLRRTEDDYLASSETPFVVEDREVSRLLLQNGQRIQLGKRGRLRFRKPVAASATAILQLTAAGIARRDVRHIVLLADSILFGSKGCHFNVDGIDGVVMLSFDDGQFTLRRFGVKESDTEMVPSETVRMDGVGFRLMETS